MFTSFNAAERAVRYPEDRRMFIGIKPYMLIIFLALLLATVGVAWLQYLVFGLPPDPSSVAVRLTAADPSGFPGWLRLSHWVNIITGTDNPGSHAGLYIGTGIILFTVAFGFVAHWISWQRPRSLQYAEAALNGTLWRISINRFHPKIFYQRKDISPYFWVNGKVPESDEWQKLAADDFSDYKLKIGGLVENAIELSLDDLKNMGMEQNITMHHCIQGWSGIAEWGGVPLKKIVELVRPHSSVTSVAFYSFGEGLYGGIYYDTHSLDNCLKSETILAWEMNYKPLSKEHGAPLRLRVENQLGYKMVKWISAIDFLETARHTGKGYGGKNEDDEYYDLLADT